MRQSTINADACKGEPGCSVCGGTGSVPDPFGSDVPDPCVCRDLGHGEAPVSVRIRIAGVRSELRQAADLLSRHGASPCELARASGLARALEVLDEAGL